MLAEHRARHGIDGQVPVLVRLGVLPHPAAGDHDVVVRQMEDAVLQINIAAATCVEAIARLVVKRRRDRARRRSDRADEGGEEPDRNRRRPRRAIARRRRGDEIFGLVRPRGARGLTEIDAVEALESFRRDSGLLKDVSFPTIAGAGPDGAIVHYRVTRKSNRRIAPGELFLINSGGQYEDGTTDITRTIAVGTPSPDMRQKFTLVLKGHIAIARAVFPDGTSGAQLDTLARQYLWQAGVDFDHGTGHGVGSYLSVHEGPARIAKLGAAALSAA